MQNENKTSAKKSTKKAKKRNKPSLLIVLLVAILAVFAVFSILNQKMEIAQKTEELAILEEQLKKQEQSNKRMINIANVLDKLEDSDVDSEQYEESLKYIEKIAREDYGYIKHGERVYINIAGE